MGRLLGLALRDQSWLEEDKAPRGLYCASYLSSCWAGDDVSAGRHRVRASGGARAPAPGASGQAASRRNCPARRWFVVTAPVLINAFRVPAEREVEFLRLWEAADAILRREKCYLTTRLHRAWSAEAAFSFVNVAELASVERWRSVLAGAEFQAIARQMAEFRSIPAVYDVVRHYTGAGSPVDDESETRVHEQVTPPGRGEAER
jgi:hypothetical protein